MIANELRLRTLIILALWCSLSGALRADEAPALRKMSAADIAAWREIADPQLTPDGAWFAYTLTPESASSQRDAVVVLRSTQGTAERRLSAGDPKLGAGKPKFSGDGRWLAFIRAEAPAAPSATDNSADTSAGKAADKPVPKSAPKNSVVLVEVSSGQETVFANIRSFMFGGLKGEWIGLQGYGATPNAGSPLLLKRLGPALPIPIGDVREFAFDREGKHVAWTTQSAEGAGNSVQLRILATAIVATLDIAPGAKYQKLSWSRDGQSLAVLREIGEKEKVERDLLTFTDIVKGPIQTSTFSVQRWKGFPAEHEFDPTVDLTWREADRGLFFGVRPVAKPADPQAPPVPEQLRLWHWQAENTPWQKKYAPTPKGFLAYLSAPDKRYIALGDASFVAAPHPRGRYVLGYDSGGTQGALQGALTGMWPRDYAVVDLGTGKRTPVVSGIRMPMVYGFDPVISPDAETVVYYLDGHYYAFDIASGLARNMTAGLPPFWDEHRQRNLDKALDFELAKLVGWSTDKRYVVISDHWDTWALPRRPSPQDKPIPLTDVGRKAQTRYDYIHLDAGQESWQQYGSGARLREAESQRWIDLDKPMYFKAEAWLSKQSGYFRRAPGRKAAPLQQLLWGDNDFGNFIKARDASVVVYTRQATVTFPDYYVTHLDFAAPRRITDANPQQREIIWSSGTRMLNYKNERGETRRATLQLPANYQAGKAYPTIVMIYEEVTDRFHRYRAPSLHGSVYPNVPEYTQAGYALLLPDIIPHKNEAGPSAVIDVLAGVKAAVATGVVDGDRMGLTGQSYGGFETSFVITQTNIFKAAAAIDQLSDLFSHSLQNYAQVDGPPGAFMPGLYLTNQDYMTVTPWEDPEAYRRSSALTYVKNVQTPLLIRQNDRDHATTFFQGVMYFNALRGLGKPVVMLQYAGAGHADNAERPEDSDDLARREREFFDHFLQGAPAPKWWTEGVP